MSHEQEDEHSIDDAEGVQSGGPSRSIRRSNGRSDEVARNEADGSVPEDGDGSLLREEGGNPQGFLSLEEEHVGPLPHQNTLRGYEDIVPGSAARIFDVYVEEARTRNAVMTRLSRAEAFAVTIGSISTTLLVLGGAAAAVWFVTIGNPMAGLVAALVTAGPAGIAKVVSASRGGQADDR